MTSHRRRTIAVVTTSRADYGHLCWPLRRIAAREEVRLKLIVLDAHLRALIDRTRAFAAGRPGAYAFVNLGALTCWSLRHASDRVVDALATVPLTESLLVKRAVL
jgi:hypothetical protein